MNGSWWIAFISVSLAGAPATPRVSLPASSSFCLLIWWICSSSKRLISTLLILSISMKNSLPFGARALAFVVCSGGGREHEKVSEWITKKNMKTLETEHNGKVFRILCCQVGRNQRVGEAKFRCAWVGFVLRLSHLVLWEEEEEKVQREKFYKECRSWVELFEVIFFEAKFQG